MMPVYIYALSACFKTYSKYLYLLIALTVLFILTILTGMYDYGVGVHTWEQINKN